MHPHQRPMALRTKARDQRSSTRDHEPTINNEAMSGFSGERMEILRVTQTEARTQQRRRPARNMDSAPHITQTEYRA